MRKWIWLLVVLTVATPLLPQDQQKKEKPVAIRAGRLIDGNGGSPINGAVILIENDIIKEVGPNVTIPANAEIIDLSKSTVLPGLIDCHTHITMEPSDYYERLFRRSPIDVAVMSHIYARRTLEAGFTTVRDLGADEFVDVALRNAINRGDVPGPRMQVATLALGSTGGHNDLSGFSPYLKFTTFSGVADGVDDIRKAIRLQVKNGADVIKMMASAGVLSEEESVGAPQYSQEEMNAVVQEAAMWGRKVAAHAHGPEAIKRALRAGVISVEHASLIDDEGLALAKEKGAWLVMDIYNDDYILGEYKRLGFPQKTLEKEARIGRLQRENFRKAVQAKVKLAFGTDAGVYPNGWNARQFAKMVEWGMPPMQAIQAATSRAADLLGWSDRVGSIAPGHFADIIAVNGNPLENISELERVAFVMKGGKVCKTPPRLLSDEESRP
jgi:imidazolonepropionase-like amidohydrolase